ncbi:MAG: hypothetical protein AEth_01966 [Candidatus Argoarchaeum ethanivorans]|uniref:Uncharacterized protein n=1 Tax=Candidatus Argoarchaeum ethanivorans TaxID=2608793 RepID=A0A8B3RYF4_9EURY|nr:MAG: hypothetical protein AEth_01966 [Candidatus Argoarchaeum ethanivorans]
MQLSMYDPVLIMNIKTIITTANVVLLVLLLAIYIRSYAQIKSKFTLGLMIFVFILLLQAVTSTPCMHAAACGRRMCVLGPLDVIPDILEFMALLVLLYLSSE